MTPSWRTCDDPGCDAPVPFNHDACPDHRDTDEDDDDGGAAVLVPDGGTEPEIVYVAAQVEGGPSTHYHTDRDCRLLNKANTVHPKPAHTIVEHREHCQLCSGEWTNGDADPDQSLHDRLAAADFTPDDLEELSAVDRADRPVSGGGER